MRAAFKKLFVLTLALAAVLPLAACGARRDGGNKIDISDALGGSAIVSANDLTAFVERGEGGTAVLQSNIDLERGMLKFTKARGAITIEGNGFTITGSGDCVLRLEDGVSLTLNDLIVVGGYDGIGALGDCVVSGRNTTVKAVASAVNCIGFLTFGKNCDILLSGQEGRGAVARGVTFDESAAVHALGGMGGVVSGDGDIALMRNSALVAETEKNYSALQCARTLVLNDGAKLTARNNGLYHGAETDTIFVEGAVSVEATGGEKGTGFFVYTLNDDLYFLGSCTPEARFENGNGSIAFVKSADELPTPEPTETPEG